MAEYLVQGESLTEVADAIREKGGTSEPLSFPAGMAAAVRGLPSGGTDISLGLTAATVGQTIKVKAIDTDGKPTAWEAVENGEWEFVQSFKLSPDTQMYEIASVAKYRAIRINVIRGVQNANLGTGNCFLRIINSDFPGKGITLSLGTDIYKKSYYFAEAHTDKSYSWGTNIAGGNNRDTLTVGLGFGIFPEIYDEYNAILSDMAKCTYTLIYAKPSETIDGAETVCVYGVRR